MNTIISKDEKQTKMFEEMHSKIAQTEENGKYKCCSMCYAKAKYRLIDDYDGVDSYRCGTHCRSLNDRIRRVRIN